MSPWHRNWCTSDVDRMDVGVVLVNVRVHPVISCDHAYESYEQDSFERSTYQALRLSSSQQESTVDSSCADLCRKLASEGWNGWKLLDACASTAYHEIFLA